MNKYCLITGAASGIGFEFAKIFIQNSYNLVLVDINIDSLNKIKEDFLNEYERDIVLMNKNLCQTNIAEEIYNELREQKIEVEVLVNNAGFGIYGSFNKVDWQKQLDLIQLTVITNTHLIKLFLADMLDRNSGKILNVSSISAFMPGPLMAAYFASKTYLLSLSQAVANEISDTNVNMTVLCPGMTATNFQKTNGNDEPGFTLFRSTPAQVAQIGYQALMKGKAVVVPRFYNKVITSLPRFMSLNLSTKLSRRVQENNRK